MLTLTIDGREAVPVRAVPFVTHGFLTPSVVARGLYLPNEIAEEWGAPGLFPNAHRVLSDGTIEWLPALTHEPWARNIVDSPDPIDPSEWLKLVPKEYFVWRDELEETFRAIDESLYVHKLADALSGEAEVRMFEKPRRHHFSIEPAITAKFRDLVMEGFPQAGQRRLRAKRGDAEGTAVDKRHYDPHWQLKAVRIAKEMMSKPGASPPSKKAVAIKLADEIDKTAENIGRRIRRTWT